jgi:sterol desaturase/sphingolipid hydroxylase (fatty acid hydroxylase superfamily)
MNTNFFSPGFESNSNVYNSDWRNHPQYHDLHHPEYPQINHQSSPPSSYNYPAQRLSLEETLQAFIQTSNRNIQELKKVTMSNDQIMQELKQSREELKNATMSNNQAM